MTTDKVMAYVDGELNESERSAFENAMAQDDALRIRVERGRHLRQRLSAAFDPTLGEQMPDRLLQAAAAPATENVVALAPKRRAWSYREWGAMAASLIGGVILGVGAFNGSSTLGSTSNGLVARGALARALETQSAASTDSAMHLGISFQSHDGDFCRTFSIARDRLAGLACKQGDQWRVPMTAQTAAPTGEIRTAGSDTPAIILQTVDQMIDGDPLDASAEAAALQKHWRREP